MTQVSDSVAPVSGGAADAPTVAAVLLARRDDDGEALRFEGRSWTWREVVEESNRRAAALESLRMPDRPFHVGVMLENVPEYLFLLGGAALAGAVVVGINPTRRGAERALDIRHTDCQLILTDERRSELVGEDVGVADDRILDVAAPVWDAAIASAPDRPLAAAPEVTPDSLFLLIFTSGSTGAPKAVRCGQGRLGEANVPGFRPTDVLYCAMPLFHGNALLSNVMPAMHGGSTIVLKRRFSASSFLDDVREHGVTFFNTVGRALAYVLATPPTDHDKEHTLLFVLAPESSSHDAAAFTERFGSFVVEGYGSSEGSIKLAPRKGTPPGALGRPVGNPDLAVVDPETSAECPVAELGPNGELLNGPEAIGELVRKDLGRSFEGYYRNEEAQAARTRNGWFWSGDLVYKDANGDYWFAGRTADWIRVDGENFATAPVERILSGWPGAAGVAVYGVPDPVTGDRVMAAIELAPGVAFDPDALEDFLATQPDLGTKWAPRFVRVVDALPATATNKIDKKPLREQRWDGGEVWWRPGREPGWRRMTDADREELRAEFERHGRSSLLI